jgi:hypothetical protein
MGISRQKSGDPGGRTVWAFSKQLAANSRYTETSNLGVDRGEAQRDPNFGLSFSFPDRDDLMPAIDMDTKPAATKSAAEEKDADKK